MIASRLLSAIRARRACIGAAVALAACAAEPTAAPPVARVGDMTLEAPRLAELLVLAQPFPLEPLAVEELVRHWIGAAALVERARAGDDLYGPEATELATWLDRREALVQLERLRRVGEVEVADARSVFDEGRLKLLAHVLRRVGPETSASERELQRRTAERILADLVGGAPWEQAVQESQDPDTRDRSGLLGLFAPGELPAPLDRAARSLEPGQISAVVVSEAGYHVLYRPAWTDVSGLFETRLRERRLREAAEAADAGVLEGRGVRQAPGVLDIAARLAGDPLPGISSDAAIVHWEGGSLSEGVLARYLATLPLPVRREMIAGSRERLAAFLHDVSVRELRAQDAERDGLAVDAETEEELERLQREEVRYWMEALDAGDGSGPAPAGVSRHMDALVARRAEARSLPVLFEAWLLDGVDVTLDRAALESAVEEARAMVAGAGSTDGEGTR